VVPYTAFSTEANLSCTALLSEISLAVDNVVPVVMVLSANVMEVVEKVSVIHKTVERIFTFFLEIKFIVVTLSK
jgi:hypothetical protein